MIKTIIFSLLIIIVLNFILHYIKDAFTEPIVRYIDKTEKIEKLEKVEKVEKNESDKSMEMKKELSAFLSQTMI